jgi:hypothetical protein
VYGSIEEPLAAAAFEPAHAELPGALAILHLTEHGDVPIAVEIGQAGVTEFRAYAATAVGSREG